MDPNIITGTLKTVVSVRGHQITCFERGEGPLALLVHGFPDEPGTWDGVLRALADAGFRAVAPVLPGYEPGSLPRTRVTPLGAAADLLVALAQRLGHPRFHWVGHDWGAALGYLAAQRHPRNIARLVALAIPPLTRPMRALLRHPGQLRSSWYMGVCALPRVPERLLTDPKAAFVRRLWRDWSPGWPAPDVRIRRVAARFAQPGVTRGALSYYRGLTALWNLDVREGIAEVTRPLQVPTTAIGGVLDGCIRPDLWTIPQRHADGGDLSTHTIEGAGHFLHLERPDLVLPLIIAGLRR